MIYTFHKLNEYLRYFIFVKPAENTNGTENFFSLIEKFILISAEFDFRHSS